MIQINWRALRKFEPLAWFIGIQAITYPAAIFIEKNMSGPGPLVGLVSGIIVLIGIVCSVWCMARSGERLSCKK